MSYYQQHREFIIERQKQYRKNNLEYVKDIQRLWYQQNRYHIKCTICGVKYLKHNEKNHFKTKRHQRGLHGVRPKSKKQKIIPKEKEEIIEEKKIIPFKTIFVSKNKISWNLPS
jgi:hypothetical protein